MTNPREFLAALIEEEVRKPAPSTWPAAYAEGFNDALGWVMDVLADDPTAKPVRPRSVTYAMFTEAEKEAIEKARAEGRTDDVRRLLGLSEGPETHDRIQPSADPFSTRRAGGRPPEETAT